MPRDVTGRDTGDRLVPIAAAERETDPVGCEPGAGKFLNAVIEIDYEGDPVKLLEQLVQIEESLGRERDRSAEPLSPADY